MDNEITEPVTEEHRKERKWRMWLAMLLIAVTSWTAGGITNELFHHLTPPHPPMEQLIGHHDQPSEDGDSD